MKGITALLVVAMVAGCGSNKPATSGPDDIEVDKSGPQPDPEVVFDEEAIELSMERSLARQQALEQARATGVKKEADPEAPPEPPPGPRTKESIRAALELRMTGIKRCYEAAIYADQQAQGSVVFTFLIIDNGTVTAPSASGFTEAIHTCLVGEVLKARFPIGVSTPVRWPLKFSST